MEVTLSTRLETARLVLRPPRESDVVAVRRAIRKNAAHLRPWTPSAPPGEDPSSLTSIAAAIQRDRQAFRRRAGFAFLVFSRRDLGSVIGRVALNGVLYGAFHNAYLGYWIGEAEQGRGFVTEAVHAALDFAFDTVGLHRIQAAIMPRNERSLRVVERLGFRREGYAERYLKIAGEWEDHLLFAKTREEHLPTEGRVSGASARDDRT